MTVKDTQGAWRIDFHSHVLPQADHGSDGIETSLAQLALLRDAGVCCLAITPHFYPQEERIISFLDKRDRCARLLLPHLTPEHPRIYLGAEVLLCAGMDRMERIEDLCIGGGSALLVEMPFGRLSDELYYTVERLCARKELAVVLAHIDRYHMDDVEGLLALPLFAQVNAESLCDRKMRKHLEPYIQAGRIAALGSDLHGARKDALKGYLKGLLKLGSREEGEIYSRSKELLKGALPFGACTEKF